MDAFAALRGHLERMTELHGCGRRLADKDFRYRCPEELVLKEGREFRGRELPAPYERGKPKACFANCQALARAHPGELTYVEGFATSMIAIHHAWLIDSDGQVVDPTWEFGSDRPADEVAYLGIPFPLEIVEAYQRPDRIYLGLLDNFEDGHPLLRRPLAETFAEFGCQPAAEGTVAVASSTKS